MVDQYGEVFPALQYHAAYNIVVDSTPLSRMNEQLVCLIFHSSVVTMSQEHFLSNLPYLDP